MNRQGDEVNGEVGGRLDKVRDLERSIALKFERRTCEPRSPNPARRIPALDKPLEGPIFRKFRGL
jgi:hypothetical protein